MTTEQLEKKIAEVEQAYADNDSEAAQSFERELFDRALRHYITGIKCEWFDQELYEYLQRTKRE